MMKSYSSKEQPTRCCGGLMKRAVPTVLYILEICSEIFVSGIVNAVALEAAVVVAG